MHIDKKEFDMKCKEIARDVRRGEATSPAWAWMTIGAALGFIASCIKLKNKSSNTTFKADRKAGDNHGKYSYFRDC